MRIKGNHPYADAFPMASEEELGELAESIAAVGLIHPIVLTPQGEILDGRNRLAACEKAGVEPTFETRDGDDDDYKEFVIGANTTGRRESMTVQIAAASTALILGHDRRKNGRWKYGANPEMSEFRQSSTYREPIAQAGLVLDELGPAHLLEVRDGAASLNSKYEQARRQKDEREQAEARKVEVERQAEQREQRAQEFFENDAAAREWLDSKPDGAFANMRAAFSAIQEEREEIRQAEEARREAEEAERRETEERTNRHARYVEVFVTNFGTGLDMATNPERNEILQACEPRIRDRFLEIENTYLKGN
ncbi:ParB N-terminal domain-containing protein [uncultured Corynebacterium sp.]|uniref:ParB N-terminal domain-containing protein n=1 Tax=uncultured Corynebacterium sp. TaxID=159447 RepID=UPI0025FAB5C3|nr:ParB N-terminal domain-containing protein [uncultured Corynebacterium sp.]